MTRTPFFHLFLITSVAVATSLAGCAAENPAQNGSGGSTQSGSGGAASGGAPGTGGASTGSGGSGSGGSSTGGASTGGSSTGGSSTGGSSTGGSSTGGSSTGGAATGGSTDGSGGAGGRGGSAATGVAGASAGGKGGGGSATGGSTGGGGAGSSLSAGCGKAPTIASSMYNNGNPIPIMAASKQRRYILSVPANYDNTKPYRLVIAWHQLDGNDKQMYMQNYYWLKEIPDAASSTIFVAPNGDKNGTPCTGTGNGEGGCGWPDSGGSNVALGDAVVAQVSENFCIDKNKIFANGWSYGGSMSYRTACSRPLGGTGTFGVRAVAIYNGAANLSSGGCSPSKPVALYVSHGTNDNVLGYEGGVSMAQTFAKVNGCTWATPAKASGNHVCTNVMGCPAGSPVEFCSFVGQHTPDPPREGGNRWQPQEVWKFFSQF